MSETAVDPQLLARYPYLEGLNDAQRDAVVTLQGPMLMLAGAGTGKTRALTTRIAHLLITGTTHPQELLAVTFTNKAAIEMRERVEHLIGMPTAGWWIGTFHALAARILRYHAELVGLKSNFTILDDDDQLRVLKQLFSVEGIDEKRWKPRDLHNRISRWKDRGLTPDKVNAKEADDFADGKGLAMYKQYQERLLTLNAVDFGDILLHNLTILQGHADILQRYQNRFRYILVDEYQDTNVAQYLWLRLLAANHKNICCVGDDDQSIYAWRGAEVGNILRFETDFPGAKVIRLEQNYRSTPAILKAASNLISFNVDRLGKTLWTSDEADERPTVSGYWDAGDEARSISEQAESLHARGEKFGSMAILVRASHLMRGFEERFTAMAIPYRVVGGPRFYERAEIRDALAYLRLIHSLEDDLAFERIVNTPKRGIGNATIQRIAAYARAQRIPMAHAARDMMNTDELPKAARGKLLGFMTDVDRWRGLIGTTPHADLTEIVLDESGYTAKWQADKSPDAPGRLENLRELTTAMAEFDDLTQFLEHVSLVLETFNQSNEDALSLMTLHSAKGLEFDTVFLPAWEDGIFPSQRNMDQNGLKGLEEERRLAYVGVTRARKNLFISYAGSRMVHGQFAAAYPSRFIKELPDDAVKRLDGNMVTAGAGMGGRAFSDMGARWRGSKGNSFVDPDAEDVFDQPVSKRFSDLSTPGWNRAKRAFDKGRVVEGSRVPKEGEFAEQKNFDIEERVFHQKFGYGHIQAIDGDKLVIAFDKAGEKKVIASFVTRASEVV